jgi:sigma-B regulation protein RsbU (phosphoserine phosphatase)
MFCSTEFTIQKRRTKPGSTLFLYSDGIMEPTDEAGIEFDMNRLVETLRESEGLPPPAIVHTIQGTLARYTKGEPLNDDRTMLALRWAGTGV